jgi:hypothetical protein
MGILTICEWAQKHKGKRCQLQLYVTIEDSIFAVPFPSDGYRHGQRSKADQGQPASSRHQAAGIGMDAAIPSPHDPDDDSELEPSLQSSVATFRKVSGGITC